MRAVRPFAAAVVIALGTLPASTQPLPAPDDPEPGVAETLARTRAARVSDLRYDLSFTIPESRSAPITGRVTLTFGLTDRAPLALDFAPAKSAALRVLEVNGRKLDVAPARGHIVLPGPALFAGRNRVTIEFEAGDVPLNRSDDFLYTIFVPARAHEAFPCFDQPDLKARWTLALDVPGGWTTIANGAETGRTLRDGRMRLTFAETAPIPTYLFAFAAGRFSVEEASRNGRVLRMLHRETDAAKVARNRDAIFTLHAAALDWLEDYTAIPYPFRKFDMLLLPSFQFGGMEHPGAIFYNASGLLLEESATQNQLLERASTIAHETAHMWFGDLVTMQWFTDVWMKEVFANFMAAKIVNPSFPGINHDLRFLFAHYPAAYDVDRTAGTNAIRQPLDNLKDAGTLYGAIIYQKAPIVMRQLEVIIGAGALREGLRAYLKRYAFGNASWPDLIAILDGPAPEDLDAWSRSWVEERGRPIVTTELAIADGRIARLAFVTRDPYPARGLTWTETMDIVLGYADRLEPMTIRLQGPRTEVAEARGRAAPLFVLPNGRGLAYGDFRLDRASVAWLSSHLPAVTDPLTRGSAWVTLWDALLNADIAAPRLLDLGLAALPAESDELNVQRVLGYLEHIYWKFTPDAERRERAAAVEAALRTGLDRAATPSLKGAYFSTLRAVAQTPATIAWLLQVWRGDEHVPGLPLVENDFIALVQDLAIRDAAGGRHSAHPAAGGDLVQQQIARTQNPDRQARLRFIAPALSADAAERARFFSSLQNLANRRREPWVLDGLRALHHPLRADASIAHIRPALDLLQEIQRTGDIFFPKRWMDATLGGHRSPEAARIVRTFLDGAGPAYPERLRRIILSSADDLFRAAVMH
jgi:aminopeptidase N